MDSHLPNPVLISPCETRSSTRQSNRALLSFAAIFLLFSVIPASTQELVRSWQVERPDPDETLISVVSYSRSVGGAPGHGVELVTAFYPLRSGSAYRNQRRTWGFVKLSAWSGLWSYGSFRRYLLPLGFAVPIPLGEERYAGSMRLEFTGHLINSEKPSTWDLALTYPVNGLFDLQVGYRLYMGEGSYTVGLVFSPKGRLSTNVVTRRRTLSRIEYDRAEARARVGRGPDVVLRTRGLNSSQLSEIKAVLKGSGFRLVDRDAVGRFKISANSRSGGYCITPAQFSVPCSFPTVTLSNLGWEIRWLGLASREVNFHQSRRAFLGGRYRVGDEPSIRKGFDALLSTLRALHPEPAPSGRSPR